MHRVVVTGIEYLPAGVRHARAAEDAAFALGLHRVVARVAVGHERAREAVQEQLRAVAMAADGEVEDVDRCGDAPIRPHARKDALPPRGMRFGDHLPHTGGLRVERVNWRQRLRRHERDHRVVGADDWPGSHHLPEVRHQRMQAFGRGPEDVLERAAGGRPAAGREETLLAVHRHMKPILVNDDLGGDARVVPVALDQSDRPGR
jgi:hypothetical protein